MYWSCVHGLISAPCSNRVIVFIIIGVEGFYTINWTFLASTFVKNIMIFSLRSAQYTLFKHTF